MWSTVLWVCVVAAAVASCLGQAAEDRLKQFYDRIKKSDVLYCADRTKLLPSCTQCIPGLQKPAGSQVCSEFIPASQSIREEIKKLTDQRYGDKPVPDRPFGLYPCK
jgi:hypothetical protein